MDRQDPEAAPVTRHLPQVRAQLVDADDPVDGEIGWKYVTRGKDGRGSLRAARKIQSGTTAAGWSPRKMSVGVSGCLNQEPTAWPMKLVARMKIDASANNCRGGPVRKSRRAAAGR